MHARAPWLLTIIAAGACKRSEAPSPAPGSASPPDLQAQALADANGATAVEPDTSYRWYRVVATIDSLGSVPTIIGVHRDRPVGVLWSAQERLPIVVVQRDPLQLRFPVRGVVLRFESAETAPQLRGTWDASFWFKQTFPIVASPIEAPRADLLFPATEAPAFDVGGAWRFDIEKFGAGRATFHQDAAGVVTGTIIPPDFGDFRYLTGRASGNRVQLQAFDGMHAFFVDLSSRDGGKTLEGTWLLAPPMKVKLKATRAEAPPSHVKVNARMAPGKTRLTLPQLDEPPYKGNPVIVDFFGSWCPVCIDLTPELVRLQREHAPAGLRVLSIALEPGDEAESRRRLDEFRAQFGMDWSFELKITDDFVGALPPEIVDASGFPITVFLRRDHTVAAVHNGFISKAAGPEHDEAVRLLEGYVREIVGSPPPR